MHDDHVHQGLLDELVLRLVAHVRRFDEDEEVVHKVRSVLRHELCLDGAGVRSPVEQGLDVVDFVAVVVVGDSAGAVVGADLSLHVVDGVPDRDFGVDIRPGCGGVLQRSHTERRLRLRAAQAGGDRQRDRRALRACDARNRTGCGRGCQRMIFRWTEETRAADASLSTCVSASVGEKARARSRPATFGGARHKPNGARDARRSARRPSHDVPCMAGRMCAVFGRVRLKMAPRRARNVLFGAPIRRAAAKRARR